MLYSLILKPAASRHILDLPQERRQSLAALLDRLADSPWGEGREDLDPEAGLFRLRGRGWRLVFHQDGWDIQVLSVRPI